MELENGMVSGAMPYSNPYASYPKRELYMCQCCERDVPDDEIVYRRDYDKYSHDWICAECFKAEVQNMSPVELAEAMNKETSKARYHK